MEEIKSLVVDILKKISVILDEKHRCRHCYHCFYTEDQTLMRRCCLCQHVHPEMGGRPGE
jgi:hypothetical protein